MRTKGVGRASRIPVIMTTEGRCLKGKQQPERESGRVL